MKLDTEIKIKHSDKIIELFCILGTFHELILAFSRLEISSDNPSGILSVIGNNYKNTVASSIVSVVFRIFILLAIAHIYNGNKGKRIMTKSLIYIKLSRILIVGLTMMILILSLNKGTNSFNINFLSSLFDFENIVVFIFILQEIVLSILLIIKSKEKIRTIFILGLLAMLIETFVYQISEFINVFIQIDLYIYIYSITNLLYIASFQLAFGLMRTKNELKDKEIN